MTDPQAMTAGPRTAEGHDLLVMLAAYRLYVRGADPGSEERIYAETRAAIRAIEDAAFAQGVAAARAAVEGLPESGHVHTVELTGHIDREFALDALDRLTEEGA